MTPTLKQIEAARDGLQKERMGDGAGLYLRLYPPGKKSFQTRQFVLLLVLTAKRTNKGRVTRPEFLSEDGSCWTKPIKLMKRERPHRVPLSRQAGIAW